MPRLVLGPLLRYADEHDATVWVETDAPCEVEVLGRRARTFAVEGHHYALVSVRGLDPATTYRYEVRLDGERRWPEEASPFPPSTIRTLGGGRTLRLVWGSCRAAAPHEPPYTLSPTDDPEGKELDTLRAFGLRMLASPPEEWPDALLLLGDQVYADEASPETRAFVEARRDTTVPPGAEVNTFEEYTRLYAEAWSDPVVRWVLSTVPTAMIFDDHDVIDDWNISAAWVEEQRRTEWWDERIVSALTAYWLYQHLGNLPPDELEGDETYRRVVAAGDGGEILRDLTFRASRTTSGTRWSYSRDVGRVRLVVVDTRAGRVLRPGARQMVDDEEWAWIVERASGDVDHLLIASSVPYLLAPGIHGLEAWSERVCDRAWGPRAARACERLRRAIDLEHWPAFWDTFARLTELLRQVGSGERGARPASIVVLSGDVHHAYLAEAAFPPRAGVETPVYQAVCSPIRNPVVPGVRRGFELGFSRVGSLVGRALARLARVPDPGLRWRLVEGPWFQNEIATLVLTGRSAVLRLERSLGRPDHPELELVLERSLTDETAAPRP